MSKRKSATRKATAKKKPMVQPKKKAPRKSGGARATDARHAERDARRAARGWSEATFLDGNLADPFPDLSADNIDDVRKSAFSWAGRRAMRTVQSISTDPGPPIEVTCEATMRAVAILVKTLDPSSLSEELKQQLKALNALRLRRPDGDPAPVASLS